MRNLQEQTYFCQECLCEVKVPHWHPQIIPLRIKDIPWNQRLEWREESYRIQEEQGFYWDEE